MNARRFAALIVLVGTVGAALVPLFRTADFPIPQHHLIHAVFMTAGFIPAILLAKPSHDTRAGHYGWLILTIVAPIAGMMFMWPTQYSWSETHAAGHVVEHLSLAVSGFVTAYAGQRYQAGIGWAMGLSLIAMAVACAWGFGVSPVIAH